MRKKGQEWWTIGTRGVPLYVMTSIKKVSLETSCTVKVAILFYYGIFNETFQSTMLQSYSYLINAKNVYKPNFKISFKHFFFTFFSPSVSKSRFFRTFQIGKIANVLLVILFSQVKQYWSIRNLYFSMAVAEMFHI